MVIEDSPEYGLLVVEMLKATFGRDIKVERTHLASDGADRLRQGYVDCVLLDLGLPDAQGLEALGLLQETAPDLWKGATTSHELRRAILLRHPAPRAPGHGQRELSSGLTTPSPTISWKLGKSGTW